MTDAELRSIVRNKITDGTLPRDRIGVVSATYGVDQACDACSASISSGQVLYKLTRRDSEKFIFHSEFLSPGAPSETMSLPQKS